MQNPVEIFVGTVFESLFSSKNSEDSTVMLPNTSCLFCLTFFYRIYSERVFILKCGKQNRNKESSGCINKLMSNLKFWQCQTVFCFFFKLVETAIKF